MTQLEILRPSFKKLWHKHASSRTSDCNASCHLADIATGRRICTVRRLVLVTHQRALGVKPLTTAPADPSVQPPSKPLCQSLKQYTT